MLKAALIETNKTLVAKVSTLENTITSLRKDKGTLQNIIDKHADRIIELDQTLVLVRRERNEAQDHNKTLSNSNHTYVMSYEKEMKAHEVTKTVIQNYRAYTYLGRIVNRGKINKAFDDIIY